MIKYPITYTDFFGETHTEDFWFHMSKPEIAELENSVDGGFSALLQRMVAAPTSKVVVEVIKNLILLSIGERSADGKAFLKSKTGSELARTFAGHAAYEVMFMEFAEDVPKAVAWIEGMMPADLVAEVKAEQAKKSLPNDAPTVIPSLPPPPPAA